MEIEQTLTLLQEKANRLRVHSMRSTSEAGSGHPTSCLSAADIISTLFFHVMKYDPHDPSHPNNDRFILSKGHAAPILYAAWAEAGFLPPEKLLTLRRIDSEIEGHPTPRFPWVDVATGSLGQGLSVGVGMALNGKLEKLDYRVYVMLGDGECAEGAVWEAAALGSYYKLDNLVGIVDVNGLGQSQRTMHQSNAEIYRKKFEAFGWHTILIDGHNFREILAAFQEAQTVKEQPVMVVARTFKGKGVSFLEDQEGWHGRALRKGEELEKALKEVPISDLSPTFTITPPSSRPDGQPQPSSSSMAPPAYTLGEGVATREAYGTALAKLGDVNLRVVALDGDTKNSTFSERFLKAHPERFFESFIAEQNMVGVAAGLASRGKIPFASTFGCFFTRAFDQIRMSAISGVNVKYAGSHCGVSIGEDGPSQMGLEDLAMMRGIPHAVVFYPSDGVSAERVVEEAARHRGIVYIRTSRPRTPVIYRNEEEFKIGGSKVVQSSPQDRLTIVAAGVTLHESLKAYEQLKREGIMVRVIDAYSVKPIDRATLLESASQTQKMILTVEDHYFDGGLGDAVLSAIGTERIAVYKMAVQDVPRSGKPDELLQMYGISADCIAKKVKEILGV